jgi:transposase
MPRSRPPYPEEFRREAVELVGSSGRSVNSIAKDLGVSGQSLSTWVKRAEIDAGRAPGLSGEERDELRRLRRENRVLREEREILKKRRAFFVRGERAEPGPSSGSSRRRGRITLSR